MTPFLYSCTTCGKTYPRDEVRYLCPACVRNYRPGIPLLGVLSVQFDYAAIKRRFRKQQPDWNLFSAVEEKHYPPYPHGQTALYDSLTQVARAIAGRRRACRPPCLPSVA